jgi:hypothetical protein
MAGEGRRQSRCRYCGRFFVPDPRVGNRQKSCGREECRVKLKRESQKKWVEANPGYFWGRYENTKQWRRGHPDYQRKRRAAKRSEIQDEIKPGTPVRTVRIVLPGNWRKDEIQDKIILARRCGCGFYVAGRGREIQDEIAVSSGPG